jgi:uncharacterized protein (TIGR03437 family)
MNFNYVRRAKTAIAMAVCAAACSQLCSQPGLAQVAPPSILQIDLADHVLYFQDAFDLSKFATEPNVTPSGSVLGPVRNFPRTTGIADIVAINGQRVTGSFVGANVSGLFLRTAPTPGQAVADTVRNAAGMLTFEILKSDGTPIGTVMALGLAGGNAPPGAPSAATGNNYVITGGTGAFLGVRGQMSVAPAQPGVAIQRNASMTEDPANRRRNGGGTWRFIAHLIPMTAPQIATSAGEPAVFHADFSPVTAARPARAGEVLIVQATGLGPTVPGVDPGQPFPADPRFLVNSPVDVTVNGNPAEVINSIGWPGLADTYRVDFRVPGGTTAGMASIQLTAAWIAGPAVRIAVQ